MSSLPLGSVESQTIFIILALLVSCAGSVIAMRLFARVRRTAGPVKNLWLFLAGLIGGGTIWSAQLLALMGISAPKVQGFVPAPIVLALVLAIGVTMLGFYLAARTERTPLIEVGGAVLGLGVVGIHFLAATALKMDGVPAWDSGFVAASLALAAVFGALTTNRIARPITRFCKYGGALALILTIGLVYAASIGGLAVAPALTQSMDPAIVSASFMTITILLTIFLLIATATATYLIDQRSSQETTDRVRHLTMHDALTGLGNRAAFDSHAKDVLAAHTDDTARAAFAMFDLDRFNEVNDVHGRSAGDAILCEIGRRISAALEPDEFLSRSGGNEFIAIKHPVYTRREAQRFCEKIRDLISRPVTWEDTAIFVGVSTGAALHPDDGRNPTALLECADLAKRRAKLTGGDAVTFYDRARDEANRERSTLAADLRQAAGNGELELYYQQQNNTLSGEVVGFEALVRWHHPNNGLVSPAVFIPIAEETGAIEDIGEWVLREACREAATWMKPHKVAVNVAAAQLAAATLPDLVADVLAETGLPPSRLELEITESGVIHDQSHALQIINQLKDLGLSIAMDDFGTGYSSLSTLKKMPFDKIKIDREFINDVNVDPQMAAIVRATIILADSFDIPVLAEGVETDVHLDFLKDVGCHQVQGYLFGKPVPAADIRELVGNSVDEATPSESDNRNGDPAVRQQASPAEFPTAAAA